MTSPFPANHVQAPGTYRDPQSRRNVTPQYGEDDATGTSWRPTRKFVAGLIAASAYLAFDVVTAGELTRAHLDSVVPQLAVLAAFYATTDR